MLTIIDFLIYIAIQVAIYGVGLYTVLYVVPYLYRKLKEYVK